MNKAISAGLLAGGLVLLFFGFNASESFDSELSRFFTGSPTDKAVWMLVGGAILTVLGLIGLLRGAK